MRLAMVSVVRDELEFIQANIEFHAAQGVDYFAIMDNGSVDGTRELLETLKADYEIELIDQPDTSFRQGEWMTALAHRAREIGKADFVIPIDADEFWVCRTGPLKQVCAKAPVQKASRTNMLPLREALMRPDFRFYDAIFNVVRPIEADGLHATDPEAKMPVPIMLRPMPAKALYSLEGLEEIYFGSHRVKHRAGEPIANADLHIFHFPVQPYAQFLRKTRSWKQNFAQESVPKPRRAWHRRRWAAQLNSGKLEQEWRSFPLDPEQARDLERQGIVRREETIRRFFKPSDSGGPAAGAKQS